MVFVGVPVRKQGSEAVGARSNTGGHRCRDSSHCCPPVAEDGRFDC